MKDILDMKQSKNWAHKTSSWKYLTIYRFVLQFFPKHRESHFCSPPWAPFKTCWKSAAAASHDLILAEVYGKCQLLFSRSVVSDSLWPHGLQHARLPCPSPSPGVYPSSCPLHWWCHPTISFSVIPFSSWLQCAKDKCQFIVDST